jgi:hypothetical protein
VPAPNADGAKKAKQRFRAQSVFLCIAIDILYHGENGQNAALGGILSGQLAGRETLQVRAGSAEILP